MSKGEELVRQLASAGDDMHEATGTAKQNKATTTYALKTFALLSYIEKLEKVAEAGLHLRQVKKDFERQVEYGNEYDAAKAEFDRSLDALTSLEEEQPE